MIKTKPLEELITLGLYSSYLCKDKPVSIMIIARPETGKTKVLMKFMVNKGLAFMTDVTAYGIEKEILPRIKTGEIRHIIIPDLVKPLSRAGHTVANFITFINAMIEEGIARIATFADSQTFEIPVKCGVISAVVREDLEKKLEYWGSIGFISRFIPFSFNYPISTVTEIFEYIVKEQYLHENPIKLSFPQKDKKITIAPNLGRKLIPLAQEITKKQKLFGFRALLNLQCLAKASALERKSKKVSIKDIKRVIHLGNWMNLDYNVMG